LRGAALATKNTTETLFARTPVHTAEETECCIVGAGPAGVMLAFLLARQGVRVTLLEAHGDFEREFRGNTLNPAALETLARLGLADKIMQLDHAKVHRFVLQDAGGRRETFADFARLKSAYPYVLMLPQARFLELMAAEAERFPNFRLVMGARVKELVEENGAVRGVRYGGEGGLHEVKAALTVGTDGRFSRLRKLAALKPNVAGGSSMDVFWFNLPRLPEDPEGAGAVFRFGKRSLLVMMDHSDHWQVGYIIPKGHYSRLKERGLPALRRSVAVLAPELRDRVGMLEDWGQGSLLPVESDRLRRWYKPGLLLVGDAAHVMSPVGGVGINLAIEDAVVAANVLADPLLEGSVEERHLRSVQRRRSPCVRVIQYAQDFAQRHVVGDALDREDAFELPRFLRLLLRTPILSAVPTRLIAYGAWSVRLK